MEIQDIALVLEGGRVEPAQRERKIAGEKRLKASDLDLFARTLGGLLEGGVPILRALEGLEVAAHKSQLKNILSHLGENIRRGASFSDSLKTHKAIPSFFYQTVYAGEVSGRVPQVMAELSRYIEKEEALKRSIREALVYPAFILGVGFITMAVLTSYVLPKLSGVYAQFGSELPAITKAILFLSKLFLPISILSFVIVLVAAASLKKSRSLHHVLFKMPFVGIFFSATIRVRFSRLLSMMLESGIPVLEALRVVENIFTDVTVQRDVAMLREEVAKGGSFSAYLGRVSWFDALSRMLVSTGEETGRLSAAFYQIARDTEADLEDRLKMAAKLLEPTLILLMGLSVGFVVIGTVLPIFDMSGIVR